MAKEKSEGSKSNYTILFVVALFGAAMAILGTKEVNNEYAELQALRKQPMTQEEIMFRRRQLVKTFHGEFKQVKKPIMGRASFSAERYKDSQGMEGGNQEEQINAHNKMAFKDLLRKIVPASKAPKKPNS